MNETNGYKGFDKNLQCRGFQYEVGKDYKQDGDIKCCEKGFHLCENPFDVFSYYPLSDSRFCEVEGSGAMDGTNGKKAFSQIRISKEIGLNGIINAGVKFILDKVKWSDKNTNTGDRSAATNTGYYSAATNTGDYSAATNTGSRSAAMNTGHFSAATNTGNFSAATNTGDFSAATNTGDFSAATNTGDYSAATKTGDYSAATNTGDYSAATNTGDFSAATNTGDFSSAKVDGKESIAIVTGEKSKASGSLGCWIVLTERDDEYHILDVKAFKVDGEKIKADKYYTLKNGKAVEEDKDE